MSNVNQHPVAPAAPASAPANAPGTDRTADVYRRAVEAKPTGFAGDPIGAVAGAMDRIGRAAGRVFAGKELEGHDGLGTAEQRLKAATANARANPGSLQAKQEQFSAALTLFHQMQGLSPRDPRRVAVATLLVQLGAQLGPGALPKGLGIDTIGLLKVAAQIASRFGDAGAMQHAFSLEQMLGTLTTGSSPEALALRDRLLSLLGLTSSASQVLKAGWNVRVAQPGEVPSLDVESRSLVLSAQQQNPSLGVLARAWWHEQQLTGRVDRDGFLGAFQKIASQTAGASLDRRWREQQRSTRDESIARRRTTAIGASAGAPAFVGNAQGSDDAGEMFAALAVHANAEGRSGLPDALVDVLDRFAG
jgi:hypothetical protein